MVVSGPHHHERQLHDGVVDERSLSLKLRGPGLLLDPLLPPLRAGRLAVTAREVSFWLVVSLGWATQRIKHSGLWPLIPLYAKRVGLRSQRYLLRHYLMADAAPSVAGLQLARRRIEASRMSVSWAGRAPLGAQRRVTCHVVAAAPSATVRSLLDRFLVAVHDGAQPAPLIDDTQSFMLLAATYEGVARTRTYGVVVARADLLRQVAREREARGYAAVLPAAISLPDAPALAPADPLERRASELERRSDRDWAFVMSRIDEALLRGAQLDDELIEEISRARLAHAQAYRYPDDPEAGPTLDTSREIVRSLVNIKLLLGEQDDAGHAAST